MIVVTGATGQLGSRIVRHLLTRLPASEVAVSVRDPARASDLATLGVRVRRGDLTAPETLDVAFEGATQLLLVSAGTTGPEGLAQHVAGIDAAARAGVGRIVYTSHQAASAESLFAPMPDHAATEQHLAAVAPTSTVLRNGFYASTVPLLLGRAVETGELVAPADGPVSWTAHEDLAEAAAIILTGEPHPGATPPLTATEQLDLADVAGVLGDLLGRPVRRVVVDDEEWRAGLVARGVPEEQADLLLGLFLASRRGEFAAAGTDLTDLLGRPTTPLRQVLEQTVAAA